MKTQNSLLCEWCNGRVTEGLGPVERPDWSRWQCNSCSAIGYCRTPSLADLDEIYASAWDDEYASGGFATGSTDMDISRSLLKSFQFNSSGCCLDYGGGRGQLTSVLIEKGCSDVYVYEPYGNNPGLSATWVKDIKVLGDKQFDWIFMVEVIEHCTNPVSELSKVCNLLSNEGKLVITTPNTLGWRARKEGFKWREAQNPTHINLFSEESLKKCLSEAGFSKIVRCRHPVQYKATRIKSLLLSITQILGVDGGLRMVAER